MPGRRDGIAADEATTYAAWCEAHGYDPVKRRYAGDTASIVAAVPGAHANIHRTGARKVA
ncbi:MAG TPA: hypothetical protein VHB02_06120 [Acidimicrobiales bacterium]|nr:hypothetical protein [Acidimicrobiales bacterium]